jgi:6-phosphogluconolactonase
MMPSGVEGAPWTAELRLSPNGRYLYATDRRSSTIAMLTVDGASGQLTLIDHIATEAQPRGMDVDPTGRWLAASGQQSGHVSLYAIDPATGRLTLHQRVETGQDPICVEMASI